MLSNLSKSVHIGENSQILTVSNKKHTFEALYEGNVTLKFRNFY
jgi:hypothetical protein